MGRGLSFLTTIERPFTCAFSSSPFTTVCGSMPVSWLGTMWPSLPNQKFAISLSTRPFSGMGSGRITSKAESRSLTTISILSSPTP
jgi:hypothetical protein